jgi:hypothetical protein
LTVLDLSRRRFIVGTFAAVAGVAAPPAILKAAEFLPKPALEWDAMLEFLRRTLPDCQVEDQSRSAHFVSIKQVRPRLISPPKMLVGWDAMDWNNINAPGQQASIEFIDQNMRMLRRDLDSIAGKEEWVIRNNDIGIWAHADS